jgi:predicted Fe-S protein YdhL (DUF1289 family)
LAIVSSIERVKWRPPRKTGGPRCQPFDATSAIEVHAGFGQLRRNRPEFAPDDAKATAIARKSRIPYIRSGSFGLAGHAVETPCVNVCLLDSATGACLGCGRTLAEIASWASMSDAERRAVMAALPARMERLEEAKG